MKTKQLVILLLSFFLAGNTAKCQSNVAIAENASWIIYHNWYDGMTYHQEWTLYKTGGHIILDGTDYIRLLATPLYQTGPNTFHQTGPVGFPYAFRNDTNDRAYIYRIIDSTEFLWYDFNLTVGDTLNPPGTYAYQIQFVCDSQIMVVSQIDSVNYNGTFYKRFIFNNQQTDFPDLIQKIGFDHDLIEGNCSFNFENHHTLIFFCPDTNMALCSVVITGLDNHDKPGGKIMVYPDPAADHITIGLPDDESFAENIFIRDISGRLIRTIHADKNEKNIQIRLDLPDGLYLLELQGQERSYVRLFNVINP